jgi:hypothetical protein
VLSSIASPSTATRWTSTRSLAPKAAFAVAHAAEASLEKAEVNGSPTIGSASILSRQISADLGRRLHRALRPRVGIKPLASESLIQQVTPAETGTLPITESLTPSMSMLQMDSSPRSWALDSPLHSARVRSDDRDHGDRDEDGSE